MYVIPNAYPCHSERSEETLPKDSPIVILSEAKDLYHKTNHIGKILRRLGYENIRAHRSNQVKKLFCDMTLRFPMAMEGRPGL